MVQYIGTLIPRGLSDTLAKIDMGGERRPGIEATLVLYNTCVPTFSTLDMHSDLFHNIWSITEW